MEITIKKKTSLETYTTKNREVEIILHESKKKKALEAIITPKKGYVRTLIINIDKSAEQAEIDAAVVAIKDNVEGNLDNRKKRTRRDTKDYLEDLGFDGDQAFDAIKALINDKIEELNP